MAHRVVGRLFRHEGGATAIEYGLVAALIGASLVAALTFAGDELLSFWDLIREAVANRV